MKHKSKATSFPKSHSYLCCKENKSYSIVFTWSPYHMLYTLQALYYSSESPWQQEVRVSQSVPGVLAAKESRESSTGVYWWLLRHSVHPISDALLLRLPRVSAQILHPNQFHNDRCPHCCFHDGILGPSCKWPNLTETHDSQSVAVPETLLGVHEPKQFL